VCPASARTFGGRRWGGKGPARCINPVGRRLVPLRSEISLQRVVLPFPLYMTDLSPHLPLSPPEPLRSGPRFSAWLTPRPSLECLPSSGRRLCASC
jgi:hypothetical protein